MQANYIADVLMELSKLLKTYDSPELQLAAMTLTNCGAEIRKHCRPSAPQIAASALKAAPRRIDPNSMIPVPVGPKSRPPMGAAN